LSLTNHFVSTSSSDPYCCQQTKFITVHHLVATAEEEEEEEEEEDKEEKDAISQLFTMKRNRLAELQVWSGKREEISFDQIRLTDALLA